MNRNLRVISIFAAICIITVLGVIFSPFGRGAQNAPSVQTLKTLSAQNIPNTSRSTAPSSKSRTSSAAISGRSYTSATAVNNQAGSSSPVNSSESGSMNSHGYYNTGIPVTAKKTAYLTFDDGPSKQTPVILDTLKKAGIKGTFFVIGKDDDFSKQMMKRIVDEGNAIGIHSWTHDYTYIYKSESNYLTDFNRLRSLIRDVTGVDPKIMRFPGGTNNTISRRYGGHIMQQLVPLVKSMGFRIYDWNAAASDASRVIPSKEQIAYNIISECKYKTNAVVLNHDSVQHQSTTEALPIVIDALKKMGFTFGTLDQNSPAMEFKPAK